MRGKTAKVLAGLAGRLKFSPSARRQQKREWNRLPWNKRYKAKMAILGALEEMDAGETGVK